LVALKECSNEESKKDKVKDKENSLLDYLSTVFTEDIEGFISKEYFLENDDKILKYYYDTSLTKITWKGKECALLILRDISERKVLED
jgi:hypothetical protein